MRISPWDLICLFVVAVSAMLFASDVTGKWSGAMQDNNGQATFTLKSSNDTVTGSMVGADGKPYPITEGKVDGDNISFTVDSQWQGNPVKLLGYRQGRWQ